MYDGRAPAPVAQRIEHLTTDQKVRGSNPFGRTRVSLPERPRGDWAVSIFWVRTGSVELSASLVDLCRPLRGAGARPGRPAQAGATRRVRHPGAGGAGALASVPAAGPVNGVQDVEVRRWLEFWLSDVEVGCGPPRCSIIAASCAGTDLHSGLAAAEQAANPRRAGCGRCAMTAWPGTSRSSSSNAAGAHRRPADGMGACVSKLYFDDTQLIDWPGKLRDRERPRGLAPSVVDDPQCKVASRRGRAWSRRSWVAATLNNASPDTPTKSSAS
ncbi:MAG: hypothetical protein QOE61_3599 [Micromonosporaceae bacterium]|nr:hypothetical protein [Micromonosporaceae bacterium]